MFPEFDSPSVFAALGPKVSAILRRMAAAAESGPAFALARLRDPVLNRLISTAAPYLPAEATSSPGVHLINGVLDGEAYGERISQPSSRSRLARSACGVVPSRRRSLPGWQRGGASVTVQHRDSHVHHSHKTKGACIMIRITVIPREGAELYSLLTRKEVSLRKKGQGTLHRRGAKGRGREKCRRGLRNIYIPSC